VVSYFFNSSEDFILEPDDPAFIATGLKERSFIVCRYQMDLPPNSAPVGTLAGEMLKRFKNHYGLD